VTLDLTAPVWGSPLDFSQGSWEWKLARVGKVTGSRVDDATRKLKDGKKYSAERARYLGELVNERLTGEPYPKFRTAQMLWGIENEPAARKLYALSCDDPVIEVGFVPHPTIEMAGASPDGLVGQRGLVQFKCPETHNHFKTLRGAPIASEYIAQMQWEMASAERAWCDFVSFDPRTRPELQMFIKRIWRDDKRIAELEKEVIDFLIEVDTEVMALCEQYGLMVAA